MNLVFFSHPTFEGHQSMPRFTNMLAAGMKERGHAVEVWSPAPNFYKLPSPTSLKKWLGYIDQFIVFPVSVQKRIKTRLSDTLFVFTDHALGPWVPLVADRPHVIHCHDFLAQQSARGEVRENRTGWTGRQYQRMIQKGYSHGKNFISVSYNTQSMLHRFLPARPLRSEVVYNGLNQSFTPGDSMLARAAVEECTHIELKKGYLLHVGGNQWYKNRVGVIEIYNAWRTRRNDGMPLLLIGEMPDSLLKDTYEKSPYKSDIHFLTGISDDIVRKAYIGASIFLFPSKAEGFGWPIAESMASGCPVITTNEAPMTEVAGEAGYLIPRKPYEWSEVAEWANAAANMIDKVLSLSETDRKAAVQVGLDNAKRFDTKQALDRIEAIYQEILKP